MRCSPNLLFILTIILGLDALLGPVLAQESLLSCEYYQGKERVSCSVISAKVRIFSAQINAGLCLSPEERLHQLNTGRRDWMRQYHPPLKLEIDYRRIFRRGESFDILIDPHCDLEEIDIIANGHSIRWVKNFWRLTPYILPVP